MDSGHVEVPAMLGNMTPSGVLSGLTEVMEDMDPVQVEKHFLQAKQLGLLPAKYHVVKKAEMFLTMIHDLKKATRVQDPDFLERALDSADYFKYEDEMVQRCRTLSQNISRIKEAASEAIQRMDPEEMSRIIRDAQEIEFLNEDIIRMSDLLNHTSREKLLQLQMKAAVTQKDALRIAKITGELKEIFFERMGDMFIFRKYPKLKNPSEFADSKYFAKSAEKDQIALEFYRHTSGSIHSSLTDPDEAPSGFTKEAKKSFKLIQQYMGDRDTDNTPLNLAKQVISAGIKHETLRTEIYAQLVKQLTNNPNPQSKKKGWELMRLCLETFPTGSDQENFLEYWIRNHSPNTEEMVEVFHITSFEGARKVIPSDQDILNILSGKQSRATEFAEVATSKAPYVLEEVQKGEWRAVYDKSVRRPYYYHSITRETTWKKPDSFKPELPVPPPPPYEQLDDLSDEE